VYGKGLISALSLIAASRKLAKERLGLLGSKYIFSPPVGFWATKKPTLNRIYLQAFLRFSFSLHRVFGRGDGDRRRL
jgi:hypothetical protein